MSTAIALSVSVSRLIEASADTTYDLISDVTRMGDFSPENNGAEWLDGATGPRVGARFKGTNALGSVRWSTKPTITVADRGRRFQFVVPGKSGATWTYDFVAVGTGVNVTESMHQDRPSPWLVRYLQRRGGVTDRAAHLHESMVTTLNRVAAVAVLAERQPVA